MIKVTSYARQPGDEFNKVQVKAFADTKEEVTAEATFVGLPDGFVMMPESRVVTAAGEVALLKSDGTWSWVENGGGGGGTTVAFVDDALVLS